jgi:hypothetical protein
MAIEGVGFSGSRLGAGTMACVLGSLAAIIRPSSFCSIARAYIVQRSHQDFQLSKSTRRRGVRHCWEWRAREHEVEVVEIEVMVFEFFFIGAARLRLSLDDVVLQIQNHLQKVKY